MKSVFGFEVKCKMQREIKLRYDYIKFPSHKSYYIEELEAITTYIKRKFNEESQICRDGPNAVLIPVKAREEVEFELIRYMGELPDKILDLNTIMGLKILYQSDIIDIGFTTTRWDD